MIKRVTNACWIIENSFAVIEKCISRGYHSSNGSNCADELFQVHFIIFDIDFAEIADIDDWRIWARSTQSLNTFVRVSRSVWDSFIFHVIKRSRWPSAVTAMSRVIAIYEILLRIWKIIPRFSAVVFNNCNRRKTEIDKLSYSLLLMLTFWIFYA